MSTFNQVTESCFTDCVNDFTTRRLTKQEVRMVIFCCGFAYAMLLVNLYIELLSGDWKLKFSTIV